MDGYITRAELIQRVGITRMTLHRWEARGLLPKPEIRRLSGSRRSAAVWPEWVVSRCERIKESQHRTHSLDAAIALVEREVLHDAVYRDVLGIETDAEFEDMRRRSAEQRTTAEAAGAKHGENAERYRLLEQLMQTHIRLALTHTLGEDAVPARLDAALTRTHVAARTDQLVQVGVNPVLVWSPIGLEILPDFRVADRLASSEHPLPCGTIVPLRHIYQRARRLAQLEPFPEPAVAPIQRVRISNGREEIEVPYSAPSPFGWEYSPDDRARIRKLFTPPPPAEQSTD